MCLGSSEQVVVPKWNVNRHGVASLKASKKDNHRYVASVGVRYESLSQLALPSGLVKLSEVEKPRVDAKGNPVMSTGDLRSETGEHKSAGQINALSLDDLAPQEGTLEPQALENLSAEQLLDLSNQIDDERDKKSGDLMISGKLLNCKVDFLVDTGACISAISIRLWNRMRQFKNPPQLLPYRGTITSVSGEEVNVVGQVILWLEIEGRYYLSQFLIFEMGRTANAILGLDFIKRYHLDWNAKLGHVSLRNAQLCNRLAQPVKEEKSCKLETVERTILPAKSECIVMVKGSGRRAENAPTFGVAEMSLNVVRQYSVIAARTLVDSRGTMPIRMMNPTESTVVLPRGTSVAVLSPIMRVEKTLHPESGITERVVKMNTHPVLEGQTNVGSANIQDGSLVDQDSATETAFKQLSRYVEGVTAGIAGASSVSLTAAAKSDREWLHETNEPPKSSLTSLSSQGGNEDEIGELKCSTGTPENLHAVSKDPDETGQVSLAGGSGDREARRRMASGTEGVTLPLDTKLAVSANSGPREGTVPGASSQAMNLETDEMPLCEVSTPLGGRLKVPIHLEDLFQSSITHLNEEQSAMLAEFLRENADVFATHGDDLGRTHVVKHHIDTEGSAPIKRLLEGFLFIRGKK